MTEQGLFVNIYVHMLRSHNKFILRENLHMFKIIIPFYIVFIYDLVSLNTIKN